MLAPLVQVLALLWLAWGLFRYVRFRLRVSRQLSGVPGPPYPLPLLGNVWHMLGPMEGILDRGNAVFDRYGPGPIKFWIGEVPSVQLMRPEDIEPVLNSQKEVDKPDLIYKPVRDFFGDGLITLNGDAWFVHRRALTPAFHFSILERYAGIFTRRAAAFAEQLAVDVVPGRSFNIMPTFSALVTETILETAFGMVSGSAGAVRDKHTTAEFVRASEDAFRVIIHRVFHPWLFVGAIFRRTRWGHMQQKAEAIICDYARRVIAAKKAQLQQEQAEQNGVEEEKEDEDEDDGVRRKFTFLDMALRSKEGVLSDREILEEVRTLIAVQQTSASTMSFIMNMLALYPEVQERARKEVQDADAVPGLHPLERLKRLKYVERVIKETLRLFPITAIFSRRLKGEVRLPDHTLPGGVLATIFIYQTHRDPRHWPDPERFDPDRFLPDNCVGRHPYAYVPFSAGPRNCIGQRYAMLQMKAVMAGVLAKFRIDPGEGCESRDSIKINMDTFLYIKGGFNVRLQPIQAQPS